jgi:hypothetical protein
MYGGRLKEICSCGHGQAAGHSNTVAITSSSPLLALRGRWNRLFNDMLLASAMQSVTSDHVVFHNNPLPITVQYTNRVSGTVVVFLPIYLCKKSACQNLLYVRSEETDNCTKERCLSVENAALTPPFCGQITATV